MDTWNTEASEDAGIDEIDREIINILVDDARISYSDLGRKVGLSRPGAKERVLALQRKGIIERFTVEVPSKYIRKPLPVFFDISFEPSKLIEAAEHVARHSDIVTVYQMSARNSVHVHGFFANMEDVSRFVNGYLVEIDGLKEVSADFLLRRFKSDRV
jgi:DNA-binding Lrp family transcriptional regulator